MVNVLTPNTTISDAGLTNNEIKTFYKKGLIRYSEKRTVFNQFGTKATIPKNEGGTYEWRRATQLTKVTGASVLIATEGSTPNGSTLSFNKVTAAPAQYGDYYPGTDRLNATIYDPIRAIVIDAQAYQVAQVVDNLIQVGVLAGSTNHQFSSLTGTNTARNQVKTADVLNELELRKAVRTLRRNSARPISDGEFVAVIHPDTTYSLFSDPDIREALVTAKMQAAGGKAGSLFTGEIGSYMGISFVESELAPVALAAGFNSQTVYLTVVFGMDYFGKVDISGLTLDSIFHDVGSAGAADPLNQRWTQGWKLTHASQILNELNAVVIEHSNF